MKRPRHLAAALFVLGAAATAFAALAFANNVAVVARQWGVLARTGFLPSESGGPAGGFLPWLDWAAIDLSCATTFIPLLGFLLATAGAWRVLRGRPAADPERFERTNLNRQLLCTEKTLGRHKAAAAAERAAAVAPDCRFFGHVCRLDEKTLPGLLHGCDAALDALDNPESRRLLKAECDRQGVPYIFGAVGGWVAQAAFSVPGDGLLEQLFPEDYVQEDKSVLPFTPALGAALQAALCARFLCGRPVEPGRLYSFDLLRTDFREIALDPPPKG